MDGTFQKQRLLLHRHHRVMRSTRSKKLHKENIQNAPLIGTSISEHHPSKNITFWKVLPPLFAPSVSGGDLRTLLFSHGPALAEAPTQNHH